MKPAPSSFGGRPGLRLSTAGRRVHRAWFGLAAAAFLLSGCQPARPGATPIPSAPVRVQPGRPIHTPTHTAAEAAFARNLNPLLGLPAGAGERVDARPLAYAIRFDAAPAQVAGLQALEWVVEAPPAPPVGGSTPVETWSLTGLSLRPAPNRPSLGPVGLAGSLQLTVARAFGAAQLFASGADPSAAEAFAEADIPLILLSIDASDGAPSSPGPDAAPTPAGPPPAPGWRFDEAPPDGEPVGALTLPQSADRATVWRYSAPFGVWQRYHATGQTLAAVLDADTGEPLTAANLLLLVLHGSPALDSAWIGEGAARLLRDGRVVEGSWRRADALAPLRLGGASGDRLTLRPGNTWLILVDAKAPYALSP